MFSSTPNTGTFYVITSAPPDGSKRRYVFSVFAKSVDEARCLGRAKLSSVLRGTWRITGIRDEYAVRKPWN